MEVDSARFLTTKAAKVAKTAKKVRLVKKSFVCARYAMGAFALLTLASMSRYPGGTYLNRDSDRYLFLQNFLSDLGMPRAWGGEVNPWGALLFVEMVGIASYGATLAAAFLVLTIAMDHRFSRTSVVAAVLVAMAVGSYATVIEWGPTLDTFYGLTFQVTAQKLFFAILLTGIAYLSFVAERVSTHAVTVRRT